MIKLFRKKEVSVVFWAHLRGSTTYHDKIERFHVEKTATDFFDWLVKKRAEIEKNSEPVVVLNCGIIR